MAITLTAVGVGVKAQSATGDVEVSLTQAVPAGKLLVLGAFATSIVTLTGVTDDQSNTYTPQSGRNSGQGNGYWVLAPVTTGLASGEKIYAAFSGVAARRFVVAVMVDGAAASYFDTQGSSSQTGTSAAPVVNTGPQAEAGEMVLAWLFATSPLVTITEDPLWDDFGEAVTDSRKLHVAGREMATTSADVYEPTFDSSRSWSANWIAIKAAGSSGYTLTAAAAAFTLTGRAATLRAARRLAAAVRTYSLAGSNNAMRRGYRLGAVVQSYAVTGQAARLARGLKLRATVAAFTLTGIAATLSRTVAGRTLSAASAVFTLTGQAAGLKAGRKIRAVSEGFVWARLAAGLRWTRKLPAAPGAFVLTGQAVGWGRTHILTPMPASFLLTGSAATLRYSGGQGWQPVPGTPETWTPKAGKSETWTPTSDTPEIWS